MKKLLVLAALGLGLTFFQTSSAGDLRYGVGFIKAISDSLKITAIDCPDSRKKSLEINSWCGKTELDVTLFKNVYATVALARSTISNYSFKTGDDWEEISSGIFFRSDYLDKMLFMASIFNVNSTNYVTFATGASFDMNDKVAPSSSVAPISPSLPISNPDSSIPKPVTVSQVASPDVIVLRYLCDQPSTSGYARVFGTVKNSSFRDLNYLKFNVEYFNGSKFVGQKSGFIQADNLKPGNESTFEGLASTPAFTRCELSFEDSTGKLKTQLP
jgi:hypothetical protein